MDTLETHEKNRKSQQRKDIKMNKMEISEPKNMISSF